MWYGPFYTSCLRDRPLIVLYALAAPHGLRLRAENASRIHDIYILAHLISLKEHNKLIFQVCADQIFFGAYSFSLEFHPHVWYTPKSWSFIWYEWEWMTNRGHLFLQMLYGNDLISVCHPVDENWMVGSCRQNLTVYVVGMATCLQRALARDEQWCYYCLCWGSVFTINFCNRFE